MITIGSLFSGIGGLELGLEVATGGHVIWQAETDPFCREVLARHWPSVYRYEDVKAIDDRTERPTIICGGFPCQDVSNAGNRAGLDGARSGLWSEYARIVRLLRPRLVFIENVPGLFARGFDRVLCDLAACGYDAEWSVFSAQGAGAPHIRKRVFILAWPQSSSPADAELDELRERRQRDGVEHDDARTPEPRVDGAARHVADPGRRGQRQGEDICPGEPEPELGGDHVADTDGGRRQGGGLAEPRGEQGARGGEPDRRRDLGHEHAVAFWENWQAEPDVGRVVDGPTARLVEASRRLKALGNAVVPQCAAWAFMVLYWRAFGREFREVA